MVIKSSFLRKFLKFAVPFLFIPVCVLLGVFVLDEKRYVFVSLAVTVFVLLLFVSGFEKKKTGTRRLVLCAVMVALSVVGRFIPFFKPITALTVITAVYIGSEAGFFVGALSAVISNFFFGQGPWTPFQMLAWGLIGFFAGLLGDKLKGRRVPLVIFGVAAGAVYSLVMDVWSVMWFSGGLDAGTYLDAVVAALPHTALYSFSNAVFLWLISKPFGEKLERVKLKYDV
ncbi:MAG: ECF transporter S component [Clostridia bacterium]|nr:ECF transporter S component [Clostridia bacterium]